MKVDADEKDELQKEAEEMNELGIRKLPRDDDGPDPDKVLHCIILLYTIRLEYFYYMGYP